MFICVTTGINITFLHIPGESSDQIAIWLPDKRVLLPADDIYKTFPNLYAIRGTPPRDTMEWAQSLRKMKKLGAKHLVPSHTRPVSGEDFINHLFTVYIAGIEYIHDQSVRYINHRLHPEDIARKVRLPPELASHRYWQEFYGTPAWSAKGVYERYLGWFSGDPVDLAPFPPFEKAEHMIDLVGVKGLISGARAALNRGDHQWCLELSSYVFRVHPDNLLAKELRLTALKTLASQQKNPLARNFYLTAALNDHGLVSWKVDLKSTVQRSSARMLFEYMKVRLIAEKVQGINASFCFNYTDTQELFHLEIQFSVLHIYQVFSFTLCDVTLTTMLSTWKDVLNNPMSAVQVLLTGKLKISGSLLALWNFVSYFEPAPVD